MPEKIQSSKLSEVFTESFIFYRKNFPVLFGVSLASEFIQTIITLVLSSNASRGAYGADQNMAFLMVGLAAIVLSLVFTAVVSGLLTLFLFNRYQEKPAGVAQVAKDLFPRIPGVFGIGLFLGLIAVVCLSPAGIVIGMNGGKGSGLSLGLFLMAIGSLVAILISFRFFLAGSAYILEGTGLRSAFARSVTLTKGIRLRIFGYYFIVAIANFVVGRAVDAMFTQAVLSTFMAALVAALISPMLVCGTLVFYLGAIQKEEAETGKTREPDANAEG